MNKKYWKGNKERGHQTVHIYSWEAHIHCTFSVGIGHALLRMVQTNPIGVRGWPHVWIKPSLWKETDVLNENNEEKDTEMKWKSNGLYHFLGTELSIWNGGLIEP